MFTSRRNPYRGHAVSVCLSRWCIETDCEIPTGPSTIEVGIPKICDFQPVFKKYRYRIPIPTPNTDTDPALMYVLRMKTLKPMIKDQIFCAHRFYSLFFSFIHWNYFIFDIVRERIKHLNCQSLCVAYPDSIRLTLTLMLGVREKKNRNNFTNFWTLYV